MSGVFDRSVRSAPAPADPYVREELRADGQLRYTSACRTCPSAIEGHRTEEQAQAWAKHHSHLFRPAGKIE